MIITCVECSHEVSDKASFCPNCGYPMTPSNNNLKTEKKKYKAKKMRLPNGFGRITKISGKNLRKPYRAMVTVGTSENGRPIGRLLKPNAYFETYNEAYAALLEYNKSPFDLNKEITVEELFDKWYPEYSNSVGDNWRRNIKSAWLYCNSVKNIPVRSLKASHIKRIMDEGTREYKGALLKIPLSTKKIVKNTFSMMLDYAVERDIVDKNIAKSISIGKEANRQIAANRKGHIPYTDAEMSLLWEREYSDLFITTLLIQCYTGWRPGELLDIKLSNVDLNEWTMTGGGKTENGRNRTIPIHTKIRPLVMKMYQLALNANVEYLIVSIDRYGVVRRIQSRSYGYKLVDLINELGLNIDHRMHDGRVTFITNAKNAEVNEYAIKRIVGHSIKDLTENVYTVRNIEWLRNEIEKIP